MLQHESQLTICTVSYGHQRHLALNHDLVTQLNPNHAANIKWLVTENAPADKPFRLDANDDRFMLQPGDADTSLGASHHHALALNALISHVRTRYLLVLDPDFYLLLPNWIDSILDHLSKHQLAFFGVPWHPKYTENYRYFPAVHCMFIDLAQISPDALDFRPILKENEQTGLSRRAKKLLGHRWRMPWDTGTRIHNRFAGKVKYECALPVFRIPEDWLGEPPSLKSRMIETFLPDRLCYFPKHRASYTKIDFAKRGYPLPAIPKLWDQFIWHDQPFGLHVRGSFSFIIRDSEAEFHLLRGVLNTMTNASTDSNE